VHHVSCADRERRGAPAATLSLALGLACLAALVSGCGSLPVPSMGGPRCAAVLDVSLELADISPEDGARGRLWLRLMPEDSGIAEESVLEWWREPDGNIALRPEAPGSRPGTAVFAPLHPARWRLSSFVLLGRIAPASGGASRTLSVAGRFDDIPPVALADGEAGLLGQLRLRAGVDRTFVYSVAPPPDDAVRAVGPLAALDGLRGVLRPLAATNAAALPPLARPGSPGGDGRRALEPAGPASRASVPPGATAGAPAIGPERPALQVPGDAVLGLAMRLERPLAEGERAEGVLRLVLRPLARTELVSVEVGWEQRPGNPAPVLVAPASAPLGRGILCPLGLAPGPYEARQVAVEGRIDSSGGRLYIDARAPVPGLPQFEVRAGELLDLGDMVCVIAGGGVELLLGEQGGGEARAPALRAVGRAVVGADPPVVERPLRTAGSGQ
jgi:hypothetical protein